MQKSKLHHQFFPKGVNCDDSACFEQRANNCEVVEMQGTIGDGTIVKYEAQDCVLTKSISSFSETEPQEVIDFFGEKKMTCEYSKDNFDETWVQGLALGVDSCDGELKDSIIELRIAQLSLE